MPKKKQRSAVHRRRVIQTTDGNAANNPRLSESGEVGEAPLGETVNLMEASSDAMENLAGFGSGFDPAVDSVHTRVEQKIRGESAGLEEEFERRIGLGNNDISDGEPEPSKYLVCQTSVREVIGGKISGQGPFFMEIPDKLVQTARPLQLGDVIMVSQWEWREGYVRLTNDLEYNGETRPWLCQGRINPQALAKSVSEPRLVTGTFRPGMVLNVKRYRGGGLKSASVMAAQMLKTQTIYARQLTQIPVERVVPEQVVWLEVVEISRPQEWWMGDSYILPKQTPFKKERLMAAAAAVQREHEVTTLAKQAVTVRLNWERPDVPPGEMQRNLQKGQQLSFEWPLYNKSAVANFLEAWEEDAPVTAKMAHDRHALTCAQGRVLGVVADEINTGHFLISVRIMLGFQPKKGYDRAWDDWEEILDEKAAILSPFPHFAGLLFRETCFELGTPKNPILHVLMGKQDAHSEQRPVVRLTEETGRLNEDQQVTQQLFVDDNSRVIFMQAPAGTGKSVTAATCIASILKRDPEAVVLAISPLNVAVCELVKDTMEVISEKWPMLALFSGQGKAKYMDRIRPLGDNLLVEAVQRDGNIPFSEGTTEREWQKNKTFKKYVDDFQQAPRRARERTTTAALLEMTKYKVYFMTLALAEEFALDLGKVAYVLIDECGQATLSAVLSILSQFPSVKKIFLTGDKLQLRVHLPSQANTIRGKFGFESVLEVLEKAHGVERTMLSKCYRSHSAIVRCLDAGIYSPAGGRLVPARPDAEMSMFLDYMGPRIVTANCPIIMIHQRSAAEADSVTPSSHNPFQRETAIGILGTIQGTFTGLIQIICFYQAECKEMRREMARRNWSRIKVGTVDSIQSQEASLVMVLTTRSGTGSATDMDTGKDFWADPARTTVALSRPKFGIIIIGDLSLLWHRGQVWRRFMDEALKMTVAVTSEYVNLINNLWPTRVGNNIARGDGTVPIAYQFYSERDNTVRGENWGQNQPSSGVGLPPHFPQRNVTAPIPPAPTANPPVAPSTQMMFVNTHVPPPPPVGILMTAQGPMNVGRTFVPSARPTPYPQQQMPVKTHAAPLQASMNQNLEQRDGPKCYRCGKIGHIARRCRT